MMKMVKPMLLKRIENKDIDSLNDNDYFVYEKYDGFRAIFDNGKFYGRSKEKWDYYFPRIFKILKESYTNCVFDGELINAQGVSKSNILQQRLTTNKFMQQVMNGTYNEEMKPTLPAKYMIFDILEKNGISLRDKPLEERQEILKATITDNMFIERVKPIDKPIKKAFKDVMEKGGEGIVIKKKGSPYVETTGTKRTDYWFKIKREVSKIIKFDGYVNSPSGIVLTDSKDNFRCTCNGYQSKAVKEEIDSRGFAMIEVNGLEETENGRIRQIVFSRMVNIQNE